MLDPMQRAPGNPRGPKNSAVAAGNDQDTPTLDLFGSTVPDEAARRRDEGMRTAEYASHPWVKSAVDRWIAERGSVPFVADDIRDDIRLLASSPNVLGARINAAARKGLIRKTGRYLPSRQASRHGGVVAEWVRTGAA